MPTGRGNINRTDLFVAGWLTGQWRRRRQQPAVLCVARSGASASAVCRRRRRAERPAGPGGRQSDPPLRWLPWRPGHDLPAAERRKVRTSFSTSLFSLVWKSSPFYEAHEIVEHNGIEGEFVFLSILLSLFFRLTFSFLIRKKWVFKNYFQWVLGKTSLFWAVLPCFA